ncbi:MAG: solute:sodium symporter family transporter [Lachnospiraceae bacterium]|nr:solute:sodium symporter family transporter [Lachnospiraceae bacterium]
MAIVFIVFLLCTVAVAGIGYVKSKGGDTSTSDGYFLAGRGLSSIVIATSMLLACLSTEQISGQAGIAFMSNMSGAVCWEVGCIIGIVAMALFFAPRYLKYGVTTMPEFLGKSYDKPTQTLVSLLLMLSYVATAMPTVLYSGAIVFNGVFDIGGLLGISDFAAITLICAAIGIIGLLYTVFGGLRMVAFTDTAYGVLLLLGCVSVPFFALYALGDGSIAGGFTNLLANVPAEKLSAISPANASAPEFPWPTLFLGVATMWFYYWCTSQMIIQKTFAAKSLKEAQKGILVCAAFKLAGPLYLGGCGILAYALFVGTDTFDVIVNSNGDLAYTMLIQNVIPKPILGFVCAAIFGAVLSSFNGAVNATSTLFSLDVYKKYINPNAEEKKVVKVGQIVSFVLAAIAVCIAPFIMFASGGLYNLMLDLTGFINAPILAAVLFAMIFKGKCPPKAVKTVIPFHMVMYLVLMYIVKLPIHSNYTIGIMFWIDMLLMYVIMKKQPRNDYVIEADNVVDVTPWKHAKTAAGVLLMCIVIYYIVFSPLVLAK